MKNFIFYFIYPNYSCLDINECGTNNGKCSQICTNTHGSFACACEHGYQLQLDGFTCQGNDENKNTEEKLSIFIWIHRSKLKNYIQL